MSLQDIIASRIENNGPITIAEYMSLCLTHPEFGYYMRRDPLGANGDFVTSPEISQIFGELIGLWFVHQWEKLGKPKCILAEPGPGRGTLMADMLRATKKVNGFHEAISVRLMEVSPALKQKQWNTLAGKHHDIEWLESFDALDEKPLFLVGNEFLDALPIRQFIWQDNAWRERLIACTDNQFSFVTPAQAGVLSNRLREWLDKIPASAGMTVEYCEPALDFTYAIAEHIKNHGGAALLIDYGYVSDAKGDTLQAMRKHQYFEILGKPGTADITAHVDFAAIKQTAEDAGARVFGATPQGKFLMKIGAGQRVQKLVANASPEQGAALISGLERIASPEKMGDLFKVLAIMPDSIEHAEGF